MDKRSRSEASSQEESADNEAVEQTGENPEEASPNESQGLDRKTGARVSRRIVRTKTTTTKRRSSTTTGRRPPSKSHSPSCKALWKKCGCMLCRDRTCDCFGDTRSDDKGESEAARNVRRNMALKLPAVSPDSTAKEENATLRSKRSWMVEPREQRGRLKSMFGGKTESGGPMSNPWFRNAAICVVIVGLVATAVIVAKRSKRI